MEKKISKEQLDAARLKLYAVMMQHIGPEKKIGMGELYEAVFGRTWSHRINDTRMLRNLITEMRRDGQPVMSSTSSGSGGYWIAASSTEIAEYCNRHKTSALKSLAHIARIKKVSLAEYLGQMQLELEAGDAEPKG